MKLLFSFFAIFILLFTFTSLAQSGANKIQLSDFNPLGGKGGITCLYSTSKTNAPGLANTNCTPDTALLNRIETLLYISAAAFAVIGTMLGGYNIMLDGWEKNSKGLKMIQGSILGFVIVLSAFFIRNIVFDIITGVVSNDSTTLTNAGIQRILTSLNFIAYQILVPIGTPLAVAFIIYGGYQIITAGGEGAKISKGWKTVQNAIIGFLIIIFAAVLVSLAQRFAISFLSEVAR
ncbi:MAG: hypothetical protein ACRCXZ_10115 [Patescibacteria group bacterium]